MITTRSLATTQQPVRFPLWNTSKCSARVKEMLLFAAQYYLGLDSIQLLICHETLVCRKDKASLRSLAACKNFNCRCYAQLTCSIAQRIMMKYLTEDFLHMSNGNGFHQCMFLALFCQHAIDLISNQVTQMCQGCL